MSLNDILKLRQFNALTSDVENGTVLIHGELRETDKTCPKCSKTAVKPHQYYEKRVRHQSFAEQPTYLVFERKDYICECGKVFLERLEFQPLGAKCTKAYEESIYKQVAERDISSVARQEGVSWDIIEGIFKKNRDAQVESLAVAGRGKKPGASH
jgi:transposase